MQATDPPVERRAHPGEDNGTRTRTPALTTRRLSLRLCPPQDGPSGGIRTHMNRRLRPMRSVGFEPTASAISATLGEWSARGDSNPDLHGLNVPRLPIAPRADDGDHGRIRTATGQALDLLPLPGWATWPLVPSGGLEPPPHGLRTRRAAFTLRREVAVGANGGTRTRTSRLGRPAGTVTPHSPCSVRYQSLIGRPNADR